MPHATRKMYRRLPHPNVEMQLQHGEGLLLEVAATACVVPQDVHVNLPRVSAVVRRFGYTSRVEGHDRLHLQEVLQEVCKSLSRDRDRCFTYSPASTGFTCWPVCCFAGQ